LSRMRSSQPSVGNILLAIGDYTPFLIQCQYRTRLLKYLPEAAVFGYGHYFGLVLYELIYLIYGRTNFDYFLYCRFPVKPVKWNFAGYFFDVRAIQQGQVRHKPLRERNGNIKPFGYQFVHECSGTGRRVKYRQQLDKSILVGNYGV